MKTLLRVKTDQQKLERLVHGRTTVQKVVLRAGIVLKMMDGIPKKHIAAELSTSRHTVYRWITNCDKRGIKALLKDAPSHGRISQRNEEKEKFVVNATPRFLC